MLHTLRTVSQTTLIGVAMDDHMRARAMVAMPKRAVLVQLVFTLELACCRHGFVSTFGGIRPERGHVVIGLFRMDVGTSRVAATQSLTATECHADES